MPSVHGARTGSVPLLSALGGWRSVLVEDRLARQWWRAAVLLAFLGYRT